MQSIQNTYGNDTIQIQTEAGADVLKTIAGIAGINDYGNIQEVRLKPGTDTQSILSDVMKMTRILKFEVTKPSLHDIFIRIASPDTKEVGHA